MTVVESVEREKILKKKRKLLYQNITVSLLKVMARKNVACKQTNGKVTIADGSDLNDLKYREKKAVV